MEKIEDPRRPRFRRLLDPESDKNYLRADRIKNVSRRVELVRQKGGKSPAWIATSQSKSVSSTQIIYLELLYGLIRKETSIITWKNNAFTSPYD